MHEENGDRVSISPYANVTVTIMNHIVEVQHLEKENHDARIKKLDKDRYLELETGEIKYFEHIDNRQESYDSLRKTFKKLRYLINNNFIGRPNELFVTLTYAKNITDPKLHYKEFDKFIKRLKYRYRDKTTIDYISVVEPHASGRWHCHVLLRFNDLDSIYIPNKFDDQNKPVDAPLYDIWGHGWVKIESLKHVDNVGAYLSAYLADVEINDELTFSDVLAVAREQRQIVFKEVRGEPKKFIKGGRLHMYPPGMNIYRKSKGIIPPERQRMQFKDVKKIVKSAEPHYQKKIIIDRDDDFQNTIQYLQFNMKRNTE